MKLLCLFAVMLCAHTYGSSFRHEFVGSLASKLGLQEFQLKKSVPQVIVSEDDKIAAGLVVIEKDGSRNVVADLIEEFLNSFRDMILNGNDVLPPLDPLYVPVIGPFVYTATGLRIQGQVNNLVMIGLRWYVVDEVTFNTLRLQLGFKITLPYITAGGGVEARASVILVSHTASVDFRVLVNQPEIAVSARLGTNLLGGHLLLRELDINISISDIDIQLSGMTGSSLINSVISSVVQNVVNGQLHDELEALSRQLSDELLVIINDILKDYTLSDLLG